MSKDKEEVKDMLNMEMYFGNIEEKRQAAKIRYSLIEVIAITIIAVIGDCDGWEEIEDFCEEYEDWFREKLGLKLEYGIPTADTFARIWRIIDAKEFKKSFMKWTASIRAKTAGEVISLDGNKIVARRAVCRQDSAELHRLTGGGVRAVIWRQAVTSPR